MSMMQPGPRNLITDVAGLKVGNAQDATLKSGSTVLLGDAPFVAAVDVMGGAPGTRETDLLEADKLVQNVDALVLSGGSAFGLDAASAVADALHAQGRGFRVGSANVPIVPAAILFDLVNGGDKHWQRNPYRALGLSAFENAQKQFSLGSYGAGAGAFTANLKGGLGSASLQLPCGICVGALVAVNAFGSATVDDRPQFWASSFEIEGEYGGRGMAICDPQRMLQSEKIKAIQAAQGNTTIAIVATDAILDKAQAKRLAVAAHDGMARALVPAHTPFDGDLVFAAATAQKPLPDPLMTPFEIGHAGAICLSRAIARAVYLAHDEPDDLLPTWQQRWGHSR